MSMEFSQYVAHPHRLSFNTGLSAAKPSTLKRLLGLPRESFGSDCRPITNPGLKARINTQTFDHIRVTGLNVALDSLMRVFASIKTNDPEVFKQMGSAGMLCCRFVRGSKSALSSHSWGTAIDLTFRGEVDARGDGRCQLGLLRVYPHFHAEGWYWGAGFPREDAMHFELADETLKRLIS